MLKNRGTARCLPADKTPSCSNSVVSLCRKWGAGSLAVYRQALCTLCTRAFKPQPNFSYGIQLEAKIVSKGVFFLLALF